MRIAWRAAPLLALPLVPLLAAGWAGDLLSGAVAAPLLVGACAILFRALLDVRHAERLAHSLAGAVGDSQPIETSLARLAERLNALAHRAAPIHPVTGLPTREYLFTAIDDHLASDGGPRLLAALRFADFDRIAAFDQEDAHAALAALAQRLTGAARRDHVAAQVDRDCFAIWFGGQSDADAAAAELRVLTHLLTQELPCAGTRLNPVIEVGSACYPADGTTPGLLLTRALSARARPQVARGGEITLVAATPLAEAREAFVLEQDLAQAIADEQLTMLFQPLVDLQRRAVTGAEALLRWNHPTMGPISPKRFIPIVETIGLSDQYGAWVLNTACREIRRWQEAGLEDLRVAVNLSARQLADPQLHEKIERTLARHHLGPQVLELELTETAAMKDAARTLHLFERLHAMGISLAIDDFGSGHSSLSYLKNLPFDKLKIDREFVADVHRDADGQAICRALVELGRGLGLRVLAEGVETRDEVDALARLGCTLFQGYFFSHPLSGVEFVAFARDPAAIPGLDVPVHAQLSSIEGRLSA